MQIVKGERISTVGGRMIEVDLVDTKAQMFSAFLKGENDGQFIGIWNFQGKNLDDIRTLNIDMSQAEMAAA